MHTFLRHNIANGTTAASCTPKGLEGMAPHVVVRSHARARTHRFQPFAAAVVVEQAAVTPNRKEFSYQDLRIGSERLRRSPVSSEEDAARATDSLPRRRPSLSPEREGSRTERPGQARGPSPSARSWQSEAPQRQGGQSLPGLSGHRGAAHQQAPRSSATRAVAADIDTGLSLTWLGTNSGTPTVERNVSCTLVRLPTATQMVDCGEGTHRQLLALRGQSEGGGLELAHVDGIYITHLHGDHCFGLGAALALLDEAKAAAAEAGDLPDTARHRNHVYGPPGLADLLRASLLVTGQARRLRLPLLVTEFVTTAAAAHPPQPLDPDFTRQQAGQGQAGQAPRTSGLHAPGCAPLLVQRMAPRRVAEAPELQAAVRTVAPRLAGVDEIWSPPHHWQASRAAQQRASSAAEAEGGSWSGEDAGPGAGREGDWKHFVAAEGLFWEVEGAAGVTIRAAQLQHRVPCWGYVFREREPHAGSVRRKVVVLGDTVSSRPLAPLAAGCDLLAHEATFASGMEAKARIAQHSTGWMAGQFGAAVGARALVLTHFSARYREGTRDPAEAARPSRAADRRELEQQSWAVTGLVAEAARTFGRRDRVYAASDYFTFRVPLRPPRDGAEGEEPAAGAGTEAGAGAARGAEEAGRRTMAPRRRLRAE